MFEIDDRFAGLGGSIHAVRDDRRGLALRLKDRDARGEGDQYRFARHGREYVLFVNTSYSRDKTSVTFTVEHGNLSDESGLLATLSRHWLIGELTGSFRAYAQLVLGCDPKFVEVNIREEGASTATLKELLAALVGLRKKDPKLLDEIYDTLEAGRPLTGDQFGALLKSVKALKLRSGAGAYAAASDVLPQIVLALKGPFSRTAPNFVRHAMNQTMATLVIVVALCWWAAPNGLRVLLDLFGGQLQRETMVTMMLNLMAGALSLTIVGAAIYTGAVMIRLARREQILNFIRTGKSRPVPATAQVRRVAVKGR